MSQYTKTLESHSFPSGGFVKLSASTREGRIFKFNVKWQLRDPSKPVPVYVPVKPFTQEFPVEAGGELLNAKYAAQQYFKSVVHKSHEFILSYSEQVFYQRVGKFVFQVLRKGQGEESLYVLKYRHDLLAEDDKKSLRIFTSLDEAKAVFDSLVGQQETSPFERWQDRIEDAQKIKKRMLPGGSAKFNIPLLLALLSINKPSYATYCDILQELMLGKQDLPAFKSLSAAYDYIYGEIWLPFISHRKQNNGILILDRIAGSTAKTRTDVLVELFRLASMPILSGCFPSVYTGISESLKPSFKNELEDLNRLGELNAAEPIRPLSFLELEKAAQEICKLHNKRIIVQFLIFLTFGFRKNDGLSLRFDDMSSAGEIQMNEVEKKNRKRRAMSGKKLHPHQSTFGLACLLAFQDNLRLSLHPNDKRLINKPIQDFGFSIRALRTTAAVALIKSGATIEEIQRRLGHTTLKMTVDRYTHEMLPGEKRGQNIDEYFDLSPPDTRNPLKGGIVVGGNQLWNLEYFTWDRYVLGLCLRLISEHFDPDEWIKFKDILFAELDFRTKKVTPISAAKKGMRFD